MVSRGQTLLGRLVGYQEIALIDKSHVNISVKNAADLLLSVWPFHRVTLQHTHINTLLST